MDLHPAKDIDMECISDLAYSGLHKIELRRARAIELDIFNYYIKSDKELAELDPINENPQYSEFYSLWASSDVFNPTSTQKDLLVGLMSAYNHTASYDRPYKVELGIDIWNRLYWSKGYGSDAVNQFAEWLFSHYNTLQSIYLETPVTNVRAVRCYEKCGFHHLQPVRKDHIYYVTMSRGRFDTPSTSGKDNQLN